MNRIDRILAIQEAVELVQQAQELVNAALDGSPQENSFNAFGKFGFDQLLGNGNPHDDSLFTLIEEL